jgi:protein tyrosine/serine phosphatase
MTADGQQAGSPRHTLVGAFNFRDLGGLVTEDGRRTRTGRLFRSDTLQALTAADTAYLTRSLGVTTVLAPSPALPQALQLLVVPLAHPVVVHCAAGKDRTGLLTRYLLEP